MEIFKIAVLGIAGVLLGMVLKESKAEYAVYLSLAVCLCIFFYILGKVQYLFESLTQLQKYLPIREEYLTTIIKMIGITYIGQFASGICKDAGFSSIGNQIELFSKLTIMAYSIPILLALMETIQEFIA